MFRFVLTVLPVLLVAVACGGPVATPAQVVGEDLEMTASDFECLHGGVRVGRVTVFNELGYLDEAVEVAQSDEGATYPVGTVLQLVPQEAMVKRGAGYSPDTNDWEFFQLATSGSGTEIVDRGPSARGLAGTCAECHADAPAEWDMTCGKSKSCGYDENAHPLFDWLVENDARCSN